MKFPSIVYVSALSILLGTPFSNAYAQTVIEKVGNNCPPGYHDTRGQYCEASRSDSAPAITRVDNKCPSGYHADGGYCIGPTPSKPFYPEGSYRRSPGQQCPEGWSFTSEACISPNAR
jgi:hypothetical protein